MDRRSFLVLGATALGLAGCTSDADEPAPAPSWPSAPGPIPASDPDADLRARVAASELALIAAYRSAIAEFPRRADELQRFLDQHADHLARVAPDTALPAELSRPAEPSASASASAGSQDPGPTITLNDLADAESAAQAQHVLACDAAQDPALARDLCLMAASEAQHAAVIESFGRRKATS